MLFHLLSYQLALLLLLIEGEIGFAQWQYASWHRPAVLCGATGSWVVDVPPEAELGAIRRRAALQVVVGLLLAFATLGWLGHAFTASGTLGSMVGSLSVLTAGLALVLDAAVAVVGQWQSIARGGGNG